MGLPTLANAQFWTIVTQTRLSYTYTYTIIAWLTSYIKEQEHIIESTCTPAHDVLVQLLLFKLFLICMLIII